MISAVLLGAGESKRMGRDKLSLPWGMKTVFEHCLDVLLRSEVGEVIVVLNSRIKGMPPPMKERKVRLVSNPYYRKGMSTSIRRGVRAIHPDSEGILIALGDQPLLRTKTINALIDAFSERRGDIILPAFRGVWGHPVIFHRRFGKELLRLEGDVGGRSIIERHLKQTRVVRVNSAGVIRDIDTWEDYKRMKS
jgi:molybdenum cofactor cytidylyltransferase